MSTDTASTSTRKALVIEAWFRDEESGRLDLPQLKRWFSGGKSFDAWLTGEFADAVEQAGSGELDAWMQDATGSLALLILLDQFTRNIHRGSARAFAFDQKAQSVCLAGLAKGFDQKLPIMQRMFFYMPLEHAESNTLQAQSLERFTILHEQSNDEFKEYTRRTLESAVEHKAIIDKFGRYPYRNAVLGRTNTAEEEIWLAENNKRFGQ